ATLHAILFACSGLIGSDGLRQRHRIDGAAHNTLAYLRKHFPSELLGREGALADILSRTDDDDFRIERHGTDQNDERCRAEDSFHLRTAAGVRLRDIALGTHTEGPIVGGPCSRNASHRTWPRSRSTTPAGQHLGWPLGKDVGRWPLPRSALVSNPLRAGETG